MGGMSGNGKRRRPASPSVLPPPTLAFPAEASAARRVAQSRDHRPCDRCEDPGSSPRAATRPLLRPGTQRMGSGAHDPILPRRVAALVPPGDAVGWVARSG